MLLDLVRQWYLSVAAICADDSAATLGPRMVAVMSQDHYHRHENTARLCAQFIMHLHSPPSSGFETSLFHHLCSPQDLT